jgi:hypothetical protein
MRVERHGMQRGLAPERALRRPDIARGERQRVLAGRRPRADELQQDVIVLELRVLLEGVVDHGVLRAAGACAF